MEITIGGKVLLSPKDSKKNLAMMLWGPPGTGKTTLAATAPGRKLWVNFDPRGPASLITYDDVLVLDLAEESPSIVDRFRFDVADPMGIGKAMEENSIDTLVFDSTTNFADLALRHGVMGLKGASYEFPTLAGYGKRNLLVLQAVKNLLRMTGKLNKHVIFIAHEATPEKDKEGTVLYVTLMLGGQLPNAVPLDLSEVWHLSEHAGKRRIMIRPARDFKPMKTRMFVTSGEPEFNWKYDPDTKKGEGIATWYDQWIAAGAKVPLPK